IRSRSATSSTPEFVELPRLDPSPIVGREASALGTLRQEAREARILAERVEDRVELEEDRRYTLAERQGQTIEGLGVLLEEREDGPRDRRDVSARLATTPGDLSSVELLHQCAHPLPLPDGSQRRLLVRGERGIQEQRVHRLRVSLLRPVRVRQRHAEEARE